MFLHTEKNFPVRKNTLCQPKPTKGVINAVPPLFTAKLSCCLMELPTKSYPITGINREDLRPAALVRTISRLSLIPICREGCIPPALAPPARKLPSPSLPSNGLSASACVSAFCRPGQPSSLARGDGYSSSSSPFCYIETIIDGDAVVKEKILKFSSPMPFPSDKNSKPPAP